MIEGGTQQTKVFAGEMISGISFKTIQSWVKEQVKQA
jgi:hypothetical protein